VHDGTPLAPPHTVPHTPQLLKLVCVLVSQPLAALPSQFAQPVLHAAISQVPVAQVAVAWARSHGTPQPPQFVKEVSAVSHPLALLPSQLPVPVAQGVQPHTPAVQLAVPFTQMHAFPQAPQ
jgi:hypothetical protein